MRIAAGTDPVLRNLQITLSYSDLSIAISAVFMPVNASWCTFADVGLEAGRRDDQEPGSPRDHRTRETGGIEGGGSSRRSSG